MYLKPKILKSYLSKLKFNLGLNPKIQKADDFRKFVPEPYKAVLIAYADFELAWAWRYSKEYIKRKTEIKKLALRERENIPDILILSDMFKIPITWATVGHLFLEECKKENNIAHPGIPRNRYFENKYWIYNGGDWFDDDPCSNYKDSPEWYCPDLIKKILNSKIEHEIGCHTFSHIDCRDEVCPTKVLESEINECKKLASANNINLKSFVHPGHTIGNLENLHKMGFHSFRTDYGNILGYPIKHPTGLWEIKGTMELTYKKKWDIIFNINFYKEIIDRAIRNNSLCVFWFHPSFDKTFIEKILPDLFSYINSKKEEIFITTAGEYTDWLNKNN
ncbi:MAG: polysaccharide deacetylase family protein [Ignavibacteriae bacterium]|nr:polysaccharide deacetylase family protein [Ignavibacteriota bacterium]